MSNFSTTSIITLNIQKPNMIPVVYAKQGDLATREIKAHLVDGLTPWSPPQGVTYYALVRCRKPDRTFAIYDLLEDNATAAVTVTGTDATIRLSQQALAVPGDVYVEVNFYTKNNENAILKQLTTFSFVVKVEASVFGDDELESTNEFSAFQQDIATIADSAEIARSLVGLTASATSVSSSTAASVTVTGGPTATPPSVYNFAFKIPKGATGAKGATGDDASVTEREIKFAQTSTTDVPTSLSESSWYTTPPTPEENKYMWTRTKDTYNNNTTQVTYTVARNGTNGTGTVKKVNNVSPDSSGNVTLTSSSIGASKVIKYSEFVDYAIPSGGSSSNGQKVVDFTGDHGGAFSPAIDLNDYSVLAVVNVVQQGCAIPFVISSITATSCTLWPTSSSITFNNARYDSTTQTYDMLRIGVLFIEK